VSVRTERDAAAIADPNTIGAVVGADTPVRGVFLRLPPGTFDQ
jgi:hypothetical protein